MGKRTFNGTDQTPPDERRTETVTRSHVKAEIPKINVTTVA